MDDMEYVMHSAEPSTGRSQHRRQSSGCPFMRGGGGDLGGNRSAYGNGNPDLFGMPDVLPRPPYSPFSFNSTMGFNDPEGFHYHHSQPVPSGGAPLQQSRNLRPNLPPYSGPTGEPLPPPLPFASPYPGLAVADSGSLHDPFMGSYGWAGPRPPHVHTGYHTHATSHDRFQDPYYRMNNGVGATIGAGAGAPSFLPAQRPQPPSVLPQAPTQRQFPSYYRHSSHGNSHSGQFAPLRSDRILPALSTPTRIMSDAHYPAATLPPRSQSLVPAPLNGVQHATSQPPPPPPAPAPTSDSSTRPQQPPAPTNGPETTSPASSRQNAPARHTNPWRLSEDSTVPEPHADPYAENASQPQLFPRIPPGVPTFANEDFHGVPHHILPLPHVRSETLGSSSQQRDGPPPSQVGRHRRLVVTGSIPPRSSDDDSDLDDEEVTLRFLAAHVGHDPLASAQRLTREESIRTHQLLRGAVSNRRVASKVAVANLEAVALESLPESERMCIICYNEFATVTPEGIKEVPLRLPKCKHVFGDHCIKKWFEESDSCPYCRDKVPSETQARANTRAINEIIFQNRARAAFNNAQPPAHRSTQTSGTSSFGVSAGGPAPSSGPHTGGRRSPPDDGEQRRRTRPRHSGSRASTTALMGASTAASAGVSITTSPGSTAPRPISFGDFSRERMEPFFRPFEPSTSQPEGPAAQEQLPNPITEPEDTIMANTHSNRLPARVSLPGMSSLGLDAPPSTLA